MPTATTSTARGPIRDAAAGIPAKDFWSFVNYDPQTRSLLQTPGTPFPSVSSQSGTVQTNADGSTTIWFGPEPPTGKESNWVPTVPERAGSPSCDCMDRWIPGSIRAGARVNC
jgi:hypothetical protein